MEIGSRGLLQELKWVTDSYYQFGFNVQDLRHDVTCKEIELAFIGGFLTSKSNNRHISTNPISSFHVFISLCLCMHACICVCVCATWISVNIAREDFIGI